LIVPYIFNHLQKMDKETSIIILVILMILSGLYSGLNLAAMSLDPQHLELLTMGPFLTKEEERDCKYAKRILPLRKRGNLLLCTILLSNVAVNAIISIVTANVTSGWIGFGISTSVVLIFGEIIPQSLMTKFGLVTCYHLMWFLYLSMGITFILAFPVSAILDKTLGEEVGTVLTKNKMKRLFEMYEKEKLLHPHER
jgi:metal transporter CNNM